MSHKYPKAVIKAVWINCIGDVEEGNCMVCGKSIGRSKAYVRKVEKDSISIDNLVTACEECSIDKLDMSLKEYKSYKFDRIETSSSSAGATEVSSTLSVKALRESLYSLLLGSNPIIPKLAERLTNMSNAHLAEHIINMCFVAYEGIDPVSWLDIYIGPNIDLLVTAITVEELQHLPDVVLRAIFFQLTGNFSPSFDVLEALTFIYDMSIISSDVSTDVKYAKEHRDKLKLDPGIMLVRNKLGAYMNQDLTELTLYRLYPRSNYKSKYIPIIPHIDDGILLELAPRDIELLSAISVQMILTSILEKAQVKGRSDATMRKALTFIVSKKMSKEDTDKYVTWAYYEKCNYLGFGEFTNEELTKFIEKNLELANRK